MIDGLLTLKETANRLGQSVRTFHRKRAYYVAHGLRIVDDAGKPKVTVASFNRMIAHLSDWGGDVKGRLDLGSKRVFREGKS